MKDVLLVLNPRRITECIAAIRALNIDRLWIRNLSETDIENVWATEIMPRIAGYDRAFVVSDDAAPHQPALDHVRALLDQGHPVATGYSNFGADDMRVNLCQQPEPDPYRMMTLDQVQTWPTETVPTSFAGFSLTGMPVDMWERYPHRTQSGCNSDLHLCLRLHADGVPIVAHRSAFVWHTKEAWSVPDKDPRKRLLVGVEPSSIELEVA